MRKNIHEKVIEVLEDLLTKANNKLELYELRDIIKKVEGILLIYNKGVEVPREMKEKLLEIFKECKIQLPGIEKEIVEGAITKIIQQK